jgi:hypothetical protein
MNTYEAVKAHGRIWLSRTEKKIDPRAAPWLRYRNISNTPIARLVILIPLIGYWIILNDAILNYSALSKLLVPSGDTYAPVRLFLVYFGLCFVAVASAIYQWRCPEEIKLYPTAGDYVRINSEAISSSEFGQVASSIANNQDRYIKVRYDAIFAQHRAAATALGKTDDAANLALKRDILYLHHNLCNAAYPIERYFTGLCYRCGVVFLAMPSIDVFRLVSWALLKRLWHLAASIF